MRWKGSRESTRSSTQLSEEFRSELVLEKVQHANTPNGHTPTSVQCIMLGTSGKKNIGENIGKDRRTGLEVIRGT